MKELLVAAGKLKPEVAADELESPKENDDCVAGVVVAAEPKVNSFLSVVALVLNSNPFFPVAAVSAGAGELKENPLVV